MKIRLVMFIFTILLGIGAGLLYGWFINPAAYTRVQLSGLRSDFSTDYVLMVAENFHKDQDLARATSWLKPLGNKSPLQVAADALDAAKGLGYEEGDIEKLSDLSDAFILWSKEEDKNE